MFITDPHDHNYVHGMRINISFLHIIYQQRFIQILLLLVEQRNHLKKGINMI
jgi:hypothetical protein